MKKFLLPILLFLMFIPLYVNAETCDTNKITIENIALESKSDNVEELSQATASGKNINLNLSMSKVGDNIEYKFVFKNDSNEDYELDKTSLNLNSDYINYSFETEDNTNIVKANSSKNVILKVEYKKEVPEDKFKSGSYNDSKTMMIQLSNENTINVPDTFKNPNTGVQSYILILVVILMASGTLYVLLKKKKYNKFMVLVIGSAIIIPVSVYALCKCEINIESNVKIDYLNSYFCEEGVGYMKYRKGMTWNEYVDYIILNYQNYKLYDLNDDNTFKEIGYLKKYGMNENRHVLDRIGDTLNPQYEYAEFIVPVRNNHTPSEILYDDFFAYGKSKQIGRSYAYSYPNEFWEINNLDVLYPDFYEEVSDDENWYWWNDNIFDAKYGCYHFNGS